jgi:hypothetical protein
MYSGAGQRQPQRALVWGRDDADFGPSSLTATIGPMRVRVYSRCRLVISLEPGGLAGEGLWFARRKFTQTPDVDQTRS